MCSWEEVSSRILPESFLGLVLLINDLEEWFEYIHNKFADDTKLYAVGDRSRIQNDLDEPKK